MLTIKSFDLCQDKLSNAFIPKANFKIRYSYTYQNDYLAWTTTWYESIAAELGMKFST